MSSLLFSSRSRADLAPSRSDTFVYEYVGEVIGPTAFAKRMKDYAAGGIRHFYFMALDREVVSRFGGRELERPLADCFAPPSSSTRPRREAKDGSSTTRATPTASSPSGPSARRCAWASSPSGTSKPTRSLPSTTTSIVMGPCYFFYLTETRLLTLVSSYSHVAQPCYCGEASCVGFIGGKTQTDIGGMDDLYIDGQFTSTSV